MNDVIYNVLHFLFGGTGSIDRVALWAGITAIAAIWIAFFQLNSTRKTVRADFTKRFNDTFFTRETRGLFTLLMNSALEFDVLKLNDKNGQEIDCLPYLRIKKDITDQLKGIIDTDASKSGYSAFEVDDLLLGFFDDIAWYHKKGMIDYKTIKQTFGYYIVESYNSEPIKQYLDHEDNKEKYTDLRRLAKRLVSGC